MKERQKSSKEKPKKETSMLTKRPRNAREKQILKKELKKINRQYGGFCASFLQ